MQAVQLLKSQPSTPKTIEEARQKRYEFWETQPVPKIGIKFYDAALIKFILF